MSIPKLDAKGGIYTLTWEEEQLIARLNRLREHSDYSVSAEIRIISTSPVGGHLHQARINLTSTAALKTLAKHMAERLNTLDWGAIVEQTAVKVLAEYRKGEPPVEVGQMPVREHLAYRVDPIMVEGRPTLLYGSGGSGKSYFAIYLSVLVDIPWKENRLEPEYGKVLYLDYETSQDEFRDRVNAIQAGIGIATPSHILYRYCTRPLATEVEELQEMVAEHKVNMVVVDSVGSACGGESEGKSEFVLAMFSALRSLRVTSLLIDHTNKEGVLYGNVYKFNQSRAVWEIRRQHELDTDHIHFGLIHRKFNTGKLLKPLGFELAFSNQEIRVSTYDAKAIDEVMERMSTADQLRKVLKTGLHTVQELCSLIMLNGKPAKDGTVRHVLNRYKDREGGFVNIGDKWGMYARPD